MKHGSNHCDYVIRRAGESYDGRSVPLDGHGDVSSTCRKFGKVVPHTYYKKRPGTTNVLDPIEGTAIRCTEHEDN